MSGRVVQPTGTRPARPPAIDLPAVITVTDLEDRTLTSRLLGRVLDAIRTLLGLARPDYDEFEDLAIQAGKTVQLPHRFGGRVRWTVVDWEAASVIAPILVKHKSTTNDVLVLESGVAGTATIRVEPVA